MCPDAYVLRACIWALTSALWRADFFISALNTKLWILILMISLVYLFTFFFFAGIWWGVYLCAPAPKEPTAQPYSLLGNPVFGKAW